MSGIRDTCRFQAIVLHRNHPVDGWLKYRCLCGTLERLRFHLMHGFKKTTFLPLLILLCAWQQVHAQKSGEFAPVPESVRKFLESNCYDCHQGSKPDGGLDLEELSNELTSANAHKWTRIHDRVRDGEMPPPDSADIERAEQKRFLKSTSKWINQVQDSRSAAFGRVSARRLTNLQLERTLHDLLGINIPLATRMPEEPKTGGFTTVAEGQSMSHFQMKQHVDIVDLALDDAFKRAFTRRESRNKTFGAAKIARPPDRNRCRIPELINGHAVTWSSRMAFYGRIPMTTATEAGWYRFRIKAKGLKPASGQSGVWCTIRSGRCVSSSPLMGWIDSFEATKKHKDLNVVAWLGEGDMLEIRPGDSTLKVGNFQGGQVDTGVGGKQNLPGVAIKSIEMQRIEPGPDNDAVRKSLFASERVMFGKNFTGSLKPEDPKKSLKSLLYRFAKKSFRRPIEADDILPYLQIAWDRYEKSQDFVSALRVGYRSILCSPRFMYFLERPGKLDDFAIASRLSYLIWNRMLDPELWTLASKKQLSDPKVLRKQVERMLRDPRGKDFVADFSHQWLDLDQIDFTEPDRRLYPGFDPIVEKSMIQETQRYLQEMIDNDLDIGYLVDSDFTFLNSRLASYYGIDKNGIGTTDGDEMQKVRLQKSSQRGGLLTHGSVLKITANGTTTSPVLRGVWVSEKLLGEHIPPPPENVPAIEPDIRGAKSIRDMLAKHKDSEDCAACHRKIDPPGFALENFDPSGRWRTHYGSWKKNIKTRAQVNPGFQMSDGKEFIDLAQFKKLVLADKEKLARNVAEKLITYGTGATIQFSDRDDIEACVSRAAKKDYGFKSLLKEVVASDLFRTK